VVVWLFSTLGLGDHAWLTDPDEALWAAIAANVWVGIPFNMLLLLPGLQAIPDELYDAAEVDGANSWQRFRYITVPLLRPVALIVLVLGVIYTFKVFDLVFVLTGGGPVDATRVLPIYIYDLSLRFFRFGEAAAASTLLLLAMMAIGAAYLWLARREGAER
jgi:multiple sugar transport system permease protein